MTTLPLKKSISWSPLRLAFLLIPLALAWFGLPHAAHAQLPSPTPDGGYPNGNTAEGEDALFSVTSGEDNVAIGFEALYNNTTGVENTGTGYRALYSDTTGTRNTATGNGALSRTTTGSNNTATGVHTMFLNSSGRHNTGEGAFALSLNTIGSDNIALGYRAGINLTTGNNNIDIGNQGVAGESSTIRIGTAGTQTATFIAGIRGTTTANANAVPVVIDSAGQLGTISSSQRFKDQIEPMKNASEVIMGLKPVRFHYKNDKQNTPQFGLIAEEVAKVNPDLVVRDGNGEIYTVRYDAVNAMLLNEFLREHRKVEGQQTKLAEQESTIAELKAAVAKQQDAFGYKIAQQQKQIEVLTAAVRKVSKRVELNAPAPQLAANDD